MHQAAKLLRKAIKMDPTELVAYSMLGSALHLSGDITGAMNCTLQVLELSKEGSTDWAAALSIAFGDMESYIKLDLPKPAWWNEADMLRMSELAVAAIPSMTLAKRPAQIASVWAMRAQVLSCTRMHMYPRRRPPSREETLEAAGCWIKAAKIARTTNDIADSANYYMDYARELFKLAKSQTNE